MSFVKLKQLLKASSHRSMAAPSVLGTVDKSIPTFRTVFLLTGVVGAALNTGLTADYLFAAGLLLHFTIWFEGWWQAARAH